MNASGTSASQATNTIAMAIAGDPQVKRSRGDATASAMDKAFLQRVLSRASLQWLFVFPPAQQPGGGVGYRCVGVTCS